MISGYLRKTIWRNKTRTFFLTVGIIISIMLVTGVNISSNAMAQSLIQDSLDEIKVDFTVVPRDSETNVSQLVDKLDTLEDTLDEFVFAYAGAHGVSSQTFINPNGGEIDWGFLNTSKNYNDYMNTSHFCGLRKDIFSEPRVADRFNDVIKSNDTLNFTQEGVYIDSRTAQKYEIVQGQNISIGILSITYDYENGDKKYNLTAESINVSILGTFNLIDRTSFIDVFSQYGWWIGDNDVILLGGFNFIENQGENLNKQLEDEADSAGVEYNSWEFSFSRKFGVMIDHSKLNVMNVNDLKTQLNQIENKIRITGGTLISYVDRQLDDWDIQELSFEIALFQAIFLIISVPVILLGWFLTKTNFQLSYEKRRREIALLKVKGGISKQLKSMFFLESVIIGLSGGALGVLGGNLTSTLVLKQMFPQVLEGYSLTDVLSVILYGEFLTSSTWIVGILMGLGISLIAVRKPLKEFSNLEPIEGLQKYHEVSHAQLPAKKRDWIALIISLGTIIFTLISNSLMQNSGYGYGFFPFLMILLTLSTILLPLAPFLLIYALVKLLCGNIKFFQAIITKISRLWSKQIAVFTSKSIIRNQVRSFRLVFIVGMALSFIVMASTIRATEINYQDQMETITTADGIRINIYSPILNQNGTEPFIDMLWNEKSSVPFETFNYFYQLEESGIVGSTGVEMYMDDGMYAGPIALGAISAENFSAPYVNMNDDWFVDMTADEAMLKLRTIPNATLIPETMVQQGYEVGDIFENQIQYALSNGTINTTTLEIVGVYKAFPIISAGWNWNQIMIIDDDTINDGVCYRADFMFYPKSGNETKVTYEVIKDIFEDFDSNLWAYNPVDYFNEGSSIATSIVSFLNLESFYLLTIVTFGIAIIMYISINEKSHDMGLLRARGVEKKVIYKIQIAEGFTLILLGCAFSIVGLLGGATIALHLNTLAADFSSQGIKRQFTIPWLNLMAQLIGSLIIFITSIIIAVFIETRKSNVTKIGDLLRVA